MSLGTNNNLAGKADIFGGSLLSDPTSTTSDDNKGGFKVATTGSRGLLTTAFAGTGNTATPAQQTMQATAMTIGANLPMMSPPYLGTPVAANQPASSSGTPSNAPATSRGPAPANAGAPASGGITIEQSDGNDFEKKRAELVGYLGSRNNVNAKAVTSDHVKAYMDGKMTVDQIAAQLPAPATGANSPPPPPSK